LVNEGSAKPELGEDPSEASKDRHEGDRSEIAGRQQAGE
jgi:hypothetical protein